MRLFDALDEVAVVTKLTEDDRRLVAVIDWCIEDLENCEDDYECGGIDEIVRRTIPREDRIAMTDSVFKHVEDWLLDQRSCLIAELIERNKQVMGKA